MGKCKYHLLYSREEEPSIRGENLHLELETTGIPDGGVRWQFITRYRPSKPSYRNVLLQAILEMCKKHELTPLEIRHPHCQGGRSFVDVVFANKDDVIKVCNREITFEYYGTHPQLVNSAMPDRNHVALCIQILPRDVDLPAVERAILKHPQIRKVGHVLDIWSVHCPKSNQFEGSVLVLLELFTQQGVVPLETRASIPSWFVFNGVAYIVLFPNRPAWCFHCRYDESGVFHSRYTCPAIPCETCKKKGHTSVECAKRRMQVAKKQQDDGEFRVFINKQQDDTRTISTARVSIQRQLGELGISPGSDMAELCCDFGVLALSENDFDSEPY